MAGPCRECGCVDQVACDHPDLGSCAWAEPDLCTACASGADPGWEHPPAELLAELGFEVAA